MGAATEKRGRMEPEGGGLGREEGSDFEVREERDKGKKDHLINWVGEE